MALGHLCSLRCDVSWWCRIVRVTSHVARAMMKGYDCVSKDSAETLQKFRSLDQADE